MSRLPHDMKGCPFCPMFEGSSSSYINIEPLNPVVPGHRIFIPREHARDFAANVGVSQQLMGVVAAWLLGKPDEDFNIITSLGSSATQTVNHLHIHVVPRADNDGLQLPWTGQHKDGDATTSDNEKGGQDDNRA